MLKIIAIATVIGAGIGTPIYLSHLASHDSKVAELRAKFTNTVEEVERQNFNDCHPASNEEFTDSENGRVIMGENPNCLKPGDENFFGGKLGPILHERDQLFAKKGIRFLGRWDTGTGHIEGYDPDTGGWYLPTKLCRLDDLPGWMRSTFC